MKNFIIKLNLLVIIIVFGIKHSEEVQRIDLLNANPQCNRDSVDFFPSYDKHNVYHVKACVAKLNQLRSMQRIIIYP